MKKNYYFLILLLINQTNLMSQNIIYDFNTVDISNWLIVNDDVMGEYLLVISFDKEGNDFVISLNLLMVVFPLFDFT